MIRLLLILCLVITTPFMAFAADDSKDTTDAKNKIVVINGRKFYPLSNARAFSGQVKPMTAVKFPKVQHMPMAHNNAPRSSDIHLPQDVSSTPVSESEIPQASGTGSTTPSGKASSEVLSVFDPEGK